jgi:hypothetical protein
MSGVILNLILSSRNQPLGEQVLFDPRFKSSPFFLIFANFEMNSKSARPMTFLVVADPEDDKAKGSSISAVDGPSPALASGIKKIDTRVLSLLLCGYLFCMLDRANIGYARVANHPENLDNSLGLEEHQGGLAISIFFATYVLFEMPSNMLM